LTSVPLRSRPAIVQLLAVDSTSCELAFSLYYDIVYSIFITLQEFEEKQLADIKNTNFS